MGWVKFTGEFAKLKTMGYKFQKLYASNYMQWNRGDLRIWKAAKDITHDEFNLYDFITFIRTKPVLRTYTSSFGGGESVSIFLITIDDMNNTTYLPYTDENREMYRANMDAWRDWDKDSGEDAPIYMSTKRVDTDLIAQLKELNDLGWYELVDDENKI